MTGIYNFAFLSQSLTKITTRKWLWCMMRYGYCISVFWVLINCYPKRYPNRLKHLGEAYHSEEFAASSHAVGGQHGRRPGHTRWTPGIPHHHWDPTFNRTTNRGVVCERDQWRCGHRARYAGLIRPAAQTYDYPPENCLLMSKTSNWALDGN